MHTARLFSPLLYDLRHLTFHQVTHIQTIDIMYIDRQPYGLKLLNCIYFYSPCNFWPYSLISLAHFCFPFYCLTRFLTYGYPPIIALEDLWVPYPSIALEDPRVPLLGQPLRAKAYPPRIALEDPRVPSQDSTRGPMSTPLHYKKKRILGNSSKVSESVTIGNLFRVSEEGFPRYRKP